MVRNEIKKLFKMLFIIFWAAFGVTTIVMAALIIGDIFTSDLYWIPIIPVGSLLILAIFATIINFTSYTKRKMIFVGIWAAFTITTIVMAALIIGNVFISDEYWIPMIPVGILFVLAILSTILLSIIREAIYCPKCGILFEEKWDFCQECGARILLKCISCGAKLKGNPKYCVKCGINLSEIEVIQTSSPHLKFKDKGYINICKECGAPAKPEAKYCVFCGALQ